MTKIFISHSTRDGELAIKLMDLLQTQFNLQRDNFFLTSDEELKIGGNWIEAIREGMEEANIVLPLITPNFLESQFCLCELGATWINQKALVPVIIPPLDHNALSETPFRAWVQSLTLNSEKDLAKLAQEMMDREVGKVNIPRFNKRAESYFKEELVPFKTEMENREVLSVATMQKVKQELEQYKEAFEATESELSELRKENQELRKMKNQEEVKVYDNSKMSEWDRFVEEVDKVSIILGQFPNEVSSVLFQAYRYDDKKSEERGIYSQVIGAELQKLQNRGFVVWTDDGWQPNEEHPTIKSAGNAIWNLKAFLDTNMTEQLEQRFSEEYEGIIFDLAYSDFWESVLGVTIYHSRE